MNDRELLELAAKAAGIDVWTDIDGNYYCYAGETVEVPWNPLTDDGDALRLAVKLGLLIDVSLRMNESEAGGNNAAYQCELHKNSDPYAATRRAIVRAAAEIGKEQP
jgi:hypothetical protein